MLLKDKVVIVSGIGPGLGIELAKLAAKEGAQLAVAARTPSKLDDAEEAIRELGLTNSVLKVPTDIADEQASRQLVEKTVAEYGRVDALLNSAYIAGEFNMFENADLNDWRKIMDINVFGTLNLSLAVIPHMKKQGGGAIVMVNSMVTRKPMPAQSGYATSKGALDVAAKSMAAELGGYGIRVNSVFMGWMWGPPVEGFFQAQAQGGGPSVDEQRKQIAKNIPLGDIPDDADCAKAVIFLASDYACVITGASLDVNGGEFMS